MSENTLKKEFSKKEVIRMRNLITGKTGDRTQILSGYEKSNQDRKEGDIFEENGKKWTIKNGIKQSITKLDRFKNIAVAPILCPCCGNPMKYDNISKKMYAIHKMCFDCVLQMEQKIKLEGKWDDYERNMLNANKNYDIEAFSDIIDEWYTQKDSFVSEDGHVESWSEGNKDGLYEDIKKWIKETKSKDIYK